MKKLIRNFRVLLLPILLLVGVSAMAQRTITGTVISADDNLGVPGAQVIVRGTTTGTTTDANGRFSMNVPSEATHLVFSFMGMETQEVAIGGRSTIDVSMRSDAIGLGEVVVIGFGTATRERLTGAVSTVSAGDLRQGVFANPSALLSGKVAGVNVTQTDGRPGAGNQIRIRGGSSLSNNDPLIVIDGLPVSNADISGQTSALSSLNPNDIYSMTILRDASATAIFGSRASNGVILITTRSGSGAQPGQINVEVSTVNSLATVARRVDVLSAPQLMNLVEAYPFASEAARNARLGMFGYFDENGERRIANTCWQSEIYRHAFSSDNNVSVTGAFSRNFPFRVSVGNLHQNGILRTDHINRTTAAISLRPSLLQNHLNINANVRGSHQQSRFGYGGAIGAALAMCPTKPVRTWGMDPHNGFWQWGAIPGSPNRVLTMLAPNNPVSMLEARHDLGTGNRLFGNIQADYRLHWLPDLSASVNFGFDLVNGSGSVVWEPWSPSPHDGFGRFSRYDQTRTDLLFDAALNYSRLFGRHRLEIMAGHTFQQWQTEYLHFQTYRYDRVTPVGEPPALPRNFQESALMSFFGRLQYSFDDRYMFQASLRTDGSSRFSAENRWGVFPAVSAAWRLDREQFLANSPFITSLRLRAGWGVTGQQEGIGNFGHIARYSISNLQAQVLFGDQWFQMWRPEAFDQTRGWEETAQWNIGIDYGFLGGRIRGSIDAYHSVTTNLLNGTFLPLGSNFAVQMTQNIGSMENQGIEFSINVIPVQTNDLSVDLGLNFTMNRRQITQLTLNDDDPNFHGVLQGGIGEGFYVQMHAVGHTPNTFFLHQHLFGPGGHPINDGVLLNMFADLNGDGAINDDDRRLYRSPDPLAFLGFNARVHWRDWSLATSLRSNIGHYIFNNVHAQNANYLQMWGGGFTRNAPVNILQTGFRGRHMLSDFFLENATFLRMDYVSLSYNFGRIFDIGNLSASFTVQNVFVLTGYSGIDPEIAGGIDGNTYPFPRTFSLGLRFNF